MSQSSAQGVDPFSLSDLDNILEESSRTDSLNPSLFIFHTSRCGSTLAAQLLATNEENIVVPEYPFLDSIIQHFGDAPDLKKHFEATLSLVGRKKNAEEKRLFLKMDSWHLFNCRAIRHFYPNTPFLFLYRNPDETIASLKKLPGPQSSNGILKSSIFGFGDDYVFENSDVHLNRVLTTYYKQIHQWVISDPLSTVIEYNPSFMSFIDYCEEIFGSDVWNHSQILKRLSFHSKNPENTFEPEKPTESLANTKTQQAYEALKPLNWQRARTSIL